MLDELLDKLASPELEPEPEVDPEMAAYLLAEVAEAERAEEDKSMTKLETDLEADPLEVDRDAPEEIDSEEAEFILEAAAAAKIQARLRGRHARREAAKILGDRAEREQKLKDEIEKRTQRAAEVESAAQAKNGSPLAQREAAILVKEAELTAREAQVLATQPEPEPESKPEPEPELVKPIEERLFDAIADDDATSLQAVVAEGGADLLYATDRKGMTALEAAVQMKQGVACSILTDLADKEELAAQEVEKQISEGQVHINQQPSLAKQAIRAKLGALKKAASQVAAFKPKVGMAIMAQKRPVGHRNMIPFKYYPATVVAVNADGTLCVKYPDEGRHGMEDDSLTVDLVDLQAHANAVLFKSK